MLSLTQRCITILLEKKTKKNPIYQPTPHHTLHIEINTFTIIHSYCSFPLTCPMQLTHYNSPQNHNTLGSMWHAPPSKWYGIGLAYPTDHNMTLEAIHWAKIWNTICTVAWLSRHGARGRSLALAAVPLHPRLVSTPFIVDGWLPEQPVVLGRHWHRPGNQAYPRKMQG